MRYNTLQAHRFTAQLWTGVREQGIDGQVTETYTFSRNVKFSLIAAEKGTMYVYADEQLPYNSQIRELRDPSGQPVFLSPLSGTELVSYIGVSEPMFDVFGTRIGFRHDLSQGVG